MLGRLEFVLTWFNEAILPNLSVLYGNSDSANSTCSLSLSQPIVFNTQNEGSPLRVKLLPGSTNPDRNLVELPT